MRLNAALGRVVSTDVLELRFDLAPSSMLRAYAVPPDSRFASIHGKLKTLLRSPRGAVVGVFGAPDENRRTLGAEIASSVDMPRMSVGCAGLLTCQCTPHSLLGLVAVLRREVVSPSHRVLYIDSLSALQFDPDDSVDPRVSISALPKAALPASMADRPLWCALVTCLAALARKNHYIVVFTYTPKTFADPCQNLLKPILSATVDTERMEVCLRDSVY